MISLSKDYFVEEINRLNKINRILLEDNRKLEMENYYLKGEKFGFKSIIMSLISRKPSGVDSVESDCYKLLEDYSLLVKPVGDELILALVKK